MNIYKEFNNIASKFSYLEDNIKKIFRIFEGTGDNQIITSEILPTNFHIKDFIIPSDEIERGLNIIHRGLREIQQEHGANSGNLFYFSQYGGSKTQFLNLVKNEINTKLNNCIVVLFEDINHINPINLFNIIFSQIFQIIAKMPELSSDNMNYQKFTNDLMKYIGEIQVSIRQSTNLKKAEKILSNLRKVKNPALLKQIDELDELLHSTILVDSVKILNEIINLMQFCSLNNIIFLFLFDEVDLWLEEREDDLKFSKEFNQISKVMKNIFEIPDNKIKIFIVFACTDRVNRLFQTMQSKFETRSYAASRLNRIFNSADKVLEPGNYGSKIEYALVKLAAYYHLTNNRAKIDTNILEKALPILDEKYKILSRRMANSKIIQLLKSYQLIVKPLETGLKNWKNNPTHYGNLIQRYLPSILNRLTIKFIRKDIPADPTSEKITKDKIDGYFINYSLENEEIRTHVEIKLTKEFKGEKAYQALQFLQLHPKESCVMLIFSPTTIDKIKEEVNEYAANQGYSNSELNRLYYILIDEPIGFCAIDGINKVSNDADKLLEFLEAYAKWLEFFGNFSSQYQEVKQKIGIDLFTPTKEKPKQPEEEIKGEKKLKFTLSSEQQTCLNLLSKLFHMKKFSPSGRMHKKTVQKVIEEQSLGITDIDKYYEKMKKSNIITGITPATVSFSKNIVDVEGLDDLRQKVFDFFQRSSRTIEMADFV